MLIDCNCNGDEQLEYESVSEALADNRIVRVTRLEDGHYEVREMCDEWASARLTAEQLRAWGQELIDMANTPHQARRDSGVALNAVVGSSGSGASHED